MKNVRIFFGLALGSLVCVCALAAGTADVLHRPATQVVRPQQSVLIGAAQAGNRLVAVGERGVVVLSDDQGKSWRQAEVPVSVSLTAVRFVDSQHGFAVGHGGVVLSTEDGGERWTKRVDGIQLAQMALQAAKLSGDEVALRDAERLVADGPDKPLLDMHFTDAQHGLVIGAYNLAFGTEDGGKSWTYLAYRLPNPRGLHLYAVRVRGAQMVVVGEQGLVMRSTDAGRSFQAIKTPYAGSFFAVELPSEREIVVAGLRGNVWRSEDAGATWSRVDVHAPVSVTASTVLGEGTLILGNQGGTLFALVRAQLRPLQTQVRPPLNALLGLSGGRLLSLGGSGALVLPLVEQESNK